MTGTILVVTILFSLIYIPLVLFILDTVTLWLTGNYMIAGNTSFLARFIRWFRMQR